MFVVACFVFDLVSSVWGAGNSNIKSRSEFFSILRITLAPVALKYHFKLIIIILFLLDYNIMNIMMNELLNRRVHYSYSSYTKSTAHVWQVATSSCQLS